MESGYEVISNRLNNIFNVVISDSENKNTVTSPFSIFSCFALLAEGTTGASFSELQSAFGYGNHLSIIQHDILAYIKLLLTGKTDSVVIKMDNSIYSSKPIRTQYIESLRSKHLAVAKTVDFSNARTVVDINNRITECTNGML